MLAVEAMGVHFDLWQRYFDDFLLHKLRLGGLRGGTISQQILRAFFGQLHEQETLVRVVSLHCYIRVYHLDLAKMANLLRPLNQIQQVCPLMCAVGVWPSGLRCLTHKQKITDSSPPVTRGKVFFLCLTKEIVNLGPGWGKECGLYPNSTEVQVLYSWTSFSVLACSQKKNPS